MGLFHHDLACHGYASVKPPRSLQVLAAHRHKRSHHVKRKSLKRRDIRTSFRAPAGPGLQVPPALPITSSTSVTAVQQLQHQHQRQQEQLIALPVRKTSISPTSFLQDELISSSSSSSAQDSLASLDKVLDNLVIAPISTSLPMPPAAASDRDRDRGHAGTRTFDLQKLAAQAAANAAAAAAISSPNKPSPASSHSVTSSSSRSRKNSSSAVVASPAAVTAIYSESDWHRELEAAVSSDQLLVVKVESSSNPLLRSTRDHTLRFQNHTILPTALNAYLPSPELHQAKGYSPLGSYQSSSITFGSSASSSPIPHSSALDFGPAFSTGGSGSISMAAASSSSSSAAASVPRLSSPLHSWYQQLAASYATAGSSKLRFLSLQSDSPRAKALCRRLGVSEGLSVMLVAPGTGRKVLEICGTKIEQDLPAGLLYYADMDPAGARPSHLLTSIISRDQLEAVRTASEVAVVAYHMHGAPPCIKTFNALYAAAQIHAPAVTFGVMDVDCSDECAAAAAELDLPRVPTYIVYRGGREVERLCSTAERRELTEVLTRLMRGEPAVACSAAAADSLCL